MATAINNQEKIDTAKTALAEKENKTYDVLTNIYSYLFIIECALSNEKYSDKIKIVHLNLLIEKMIEEIKSLGKFYESVAYFSELEKDDRLNFIQNNIAKHI